MGGAPFVISEERLWRDSGGFSVFREHCYLTAISRG
nr:MAG TPA: hypothetical protein [Caudoviricetes sp.]